jgi:beta-phosphoglucomutase
MIDDMHYHIKAWHRILNELGANISVQRTKEECYGKNHELIERIFPGIYSMEEKERMSLEKETEYQQQFGPNLQFIAGFESFLIRAKEQGIKTAIGSAAIMFNINFVLDGLNIRHLIDAVVSADDVDQSKPHPETFLKCAEVLRVDPADCLVFEDAPKGVEAAGRAGMDCVVITTMHAAEEFFSYQNINTFIKDYSDKQLTKLLCQDQPM